MSLHVAFQYATSASVKIAVQRVADGLWFDFIPGTLKFVPREVAKMLLAPVPEDKDPFLAFYAMNIVDTPADVWTDGDYLVLICVGPEVVQVIEKSFYNGSDITPSRKLALNLQDVAHPTLSPA